MQSASQHCPVARGRIGDSYRQPWTARGQHGLPDARMRPFRRTLVDNGGQPGTGADVDEPYVADLDLSSVATHEVLAALLDEVYTRADRPSLRTLEARTRQSATPLSRTTVAEMLRGTRPPRRAVMVEFLRACGLHDGSIEPWRRAWERTASNALRPARARPASGPARDPQAGIAPSPSLARPGSQLAAGPHQDDPDELRGKVAALLAENQALRIRVAGAPTIDGTESQGADAALSMWHFPDGAPITLVSYRLPDDKRPPHANPQDPNYTRHAELADLDALVDIYGIVNAYNPDAAIDIKAAQDLLPAQVASHLILVGGLTWEAVTPWFSRVFPIPIDPGDPFEQGAIVVHEPDGTEQRFRLTSEGGEIVEDIGFFARGQNPSAPRRTLTICGGITTRGVHGAARCFIDRELRESNGQYLRTRFSAGATYCVVMRIPIVNRDPLAPDLSRDGNVLFEWATNGARPSR